MMSMLVLLPGRHVQARALNQRLRTHSWSMVEHSDPKLSNLYSSKWLAFNWAMLVHASFYVAWNHGLDYERPEIAVECLCFCLLE